MDSDMILGLTTARHGQHWLSRKSTLQVMCADFDQLPPGFSSGHPVWDWAQFRKHLKALLKGKAVVTSSRHGKAKAFILFENVTDVQDLEITAKDALYVLSQVLPEHLLPYVDTKRSALLESFMTQAMVADLKRGLQELPVAGTLDVAYSTMPPVTATEPVTPKALREYAGKIPMGMGRFIRTSAPRQRMMRVLLECKGLNGSRGFDLVMEKIAHQTGMSTEAVSKAIARLIELDLLECVDKSWAKGVKARTYKAKGALAAAIEKIHGKALAKAKLTLPTSIAPRRWQETFWEVSRHFIGNPEGYRAWYRTLPGIDRKDRVRQAERAVQNQRLPALRA